MNALTLNRRAFLAGIPTAMVSLSRGVQASEPGASTSSACPRFGDSDLTSLLVPIRERSGMPAMAAAIVTSGGIRGIGVAGFRKREKNVAVGLNDKWHLGSDTKAMTVSLIARLVDQGRLKWGEKLSEVFPDFSEGMNPAFKSVTIRHLLSHRAGFPANLELGKYLGDQVAVLRRTAVKDHCSRPPEYRPGSAYLYSNLGYIVAGAAVERVAGETWEQSMRHLLFEPLHMKSAGFGGTGKVGSIDQPWPHKADGSPVASNGPGMDNPPVMGPAGRVHCTIQDWAGFVQETLRGLRGISSLITAQSYQEIRTPPFGGDYALGWVVVERGWGAGKVLNHTGDNTMNFSNLWIAPEKDFAILVCANQGGPAAFKATDETVGALIRLHREKSVSRF